MPRGRGWTPIEIDRLIHLRDDRRLIWTVIARKLGRNAGSDGIGQCCSAYNYHKAKRAREAAMVAAGITLPAPRTPCDNSPIAPTPAEVALLDAPTRRPRYFSSDGGLMTRIAAQGLTAGYFGDPPPGRSALDQRQAGK